MTRGVSAPAYPGDANRQKVDRTMLAMAKLMRTQREQAAAMVALIDQASAIEGKGRLLNVRA